MANSGILVINAAYNSATANLSVNQGHGSQLATISSIKVKDVHPGESPQRKLIGEVPVLSVALTLLQIYPSRVF